MLDHTPPSSTAAGLQSAHAFAADTAPAIVAKAVGCGYEVSCQDTVPFPIWNACRSLAHSRAAPLSTGLPFFRRIGAAMPTFASMHNLANYRGSQVAAFSVLDAAGDYTEVVSGCNVRVA